jgi:hypothetical protein
MRRLMASRDTDRESLFTLKVQEVRLHMELGRAERAFDRAPQRQRERRRERIRELLERTFDLRNNIGRMEIEQLRTGIQRLQERLAQADIDRGRIVERDVSRRLSGGRRNGPQRSQAPDDSPRR